MTTLYIAPTFGVGWRAFTNQGVVLSGGKLSTYVAGSVNTPQATYTDATGGTLNPNPIVLDSTGQLPAGTEVWMSATTKFVLTDANNNPIGTWDNVPGVNNVAASQTEWSVSGLVVTYVSATQFTAPGNQTTLFTPFRRVQYFVAGGTLYCYVSSSTYDGVATTTVNIVADTTGMDATLYAVNYASLGSTYPSIPQEFIQQGQSQNYCGTSTGTNTVTITTPFPIGQSGSLAAGMTFLFVAGATNNGSITFQINSTPVFSGANVLQNGIQLPVGGLVSGNVYRARIGAGATTVTINQIDSLGAQGGTLNGSVNMAAGNLSIAAGNFSVTAGLASFTKSANIASAANVNLTTATGNEVHITGAVTITSITINSGQWLCLIFDSTPLITAGASIVLPNGGGNVTAQAGDKAVVFGDASNVCNFISFQRATGAPLTPATNSAGFNIYASQTLGGL